MANKTVHLICNAHLDPAWLWRQEEGMGVTLSTFRMAAELCEKNKNFVFNHNEAILYRWVQQYEPDLFKRIKKLVQQGRWNIMGGWYLQPDCNMPSGESFVRQILVGKRYFKEHFNVDVKTAINFDPFGHSQGLVQILAKSGYDSYLFGRPEAADLPLPADNFIWVGFDGSEILATRFSGWYNSKLGEARSKVVKCLEEFSEKNPKLILWGVGNHGGGPSRKDVWDINRLIATNKQFSLKHSSPQAYFHELRTVSKPLPRYRQDLNPWAVGCYTSQVRLKQKHRELENELFSAEKMACTAKINGLAAYPREQLRLALEDLLFGQFHDILPGSSIPPVEEDALRGYDHGLEILSRVKSRCFFAMAQGEAKAKPGTLPLLIYNPHPFPIRQILECELHLPDYVDRPLFHQLTAKQGGKTIPCQVEQEHSNLPVDWRKRVSLDVELKAGQINRIDCLPQLLKNKPAGRFKPRDGKYLFKNKNLRVVINTRSGLMDRYQVGKINVIGPKAFEPLVMHDNADSWGMLVRRFPKVAGRFRLMNQMDGSAFSGLHDKTIPSVRVIEEGPVRTIIEAVFNYNHSFLALRYKLPATGTELEVECRVFWQEKDKMLKLKVPVRVGDAEFLGQVAYGTSRLPANGDEAVAQKWLAVVSKKNNAALTCINEGSYGSDFSAGGLRLTLLRSPAYSCGPPEQGLPLDDRFSPRIDQGERLFRFWLNLGPVKNRLARVDREALVKNEKPWGMCFFPPGQGQKCKPAVILEDDSIQLAAMKLAESSNDYIVRLFEPTGKARSTTMRLPWMKRRIKIDLGRFEIKTLRINARSGKISDVNLMEEK